MEASREKHYDLHERTFLFSESLIDFIKCMPKDILTMPILGQLIRSGTSVGANYCEADCAESKKDFVHKIAICKKEAKETLYWLRLLSRALPEVSAEIQILRKEASELHLIFSAIVRTTQKTLHA